MLKTTQILIYCKRHALPIMSSLIPNQSLCYWDKCLSEVMITTTAVTSTVK